MPHPDIVAISSIGKSYKGRDIWVAKVSDNVADRRAGARGHVRLAPSRSRAPLARAEPGRPALADRGLRHRRADHPHRQRPRGLDRLRGQPRRRRVRPDRLAVPRLAQEPPAERRARPRSGRTSTGTTATAGAAAAARPARSRPRPTAGKAPSRRPRRAPSATSWPAAGSAAASRSRRPSPSTRPASRSCGRTATRRRTSRRT